MHEHELLVHYVHEQEHLVHYVHAQYMHISLYMKH